MKHVTQILNDCGLRGEWPEKFSKKDREFYLQRGSMIHKATALFDQGVLDWSSLDERIIPYIKAWEKSRKELGGQIVEIECKIKNSAFDYQGTLDRVIRNCALFPKGFLLIDIKTTEADVVTRLQTMAYAMGYSKRKVKRGFIALKSNGNYKAGIYDNNASDKVGWIACLQLNNWIERNK